MDYNFIEVAEYKYQDSKTACNGTEINDQIKEEDKHSILSFVFNCFWLLAVSFKEV